MQVPFCSRSQSYLVSVLSSENFRLVKSFRYSCVRLNSFLNERKSRISANGHPEVIVYLAFIGHSFWYIQCTLKVHQKLRFSAENFTHAFNVRLEYCYIIQDRLKMPDQTRIFRITGLAAIRLFFFNMKYSGLFRSVQCTPCIILYVQEAIL